MLPFLLSIPQTFGRYSEQVTYESIGSARVPAVEPSQDRNIESAAAPLRQMQIHSIAWYTMLDTLSARNIFVITSILFINNVCFKELEASKCSTVG